MLPAAVRLVERDGALDLVCGGIDAELAEQLEGGRRRRPFGEVGAAAPLAVGILGGEQLCAPALVRDACALSRDLVGWCIGQVSQDLPPNGRVLI